MNSQQICKRFANGHCDSAGVSNFLFGIKEVCWSERRDLRFSLSRIDFAPELRRTVVLCTWAVYVASGSAGPIWMSHALSEGVV
jgi:hypothetical protein